jgi:hypothetical protein
MHIFSCTFIAASLLSNLIRGQGCYKQVSFIYIYIYIYIYMSGIVDVFSFIAICGVIMLSILISCQQ